MTFRRLENVSLTGERKHTQLHVNTHDKLTHTMLDVFRYIKTDVCVALCDGLRVRARLLRSVQRSSSDASVH